MAADLGSLHGILKDPTRRRILSALGERGPLAYVEILGLLEIEHTGKLNYHLRHLGDLVSKDESGRYTLTEKGRLATQVMEKFQPPPTQNGVATLHVGRVGLGKLLFVLSIPSFVLSLIPLSLDFQTANDLAFLSGIITVMFVVFGAALVLPGSQKGNGRLSVRQSLGYGGLEFVLMFLYIPVFQFIPFAIRFELYGPPYIVYFLALPGLVTWFVLWLRLGAQGASELLKVPLVATVLTWIGWLSLAAVIVFGLGIQTSFFYSREDVLVSSILMTSLLFVSFFAAEAAYWLVGWKGRLPV